MAQIDSFGGLRFIVSCRHSTVSRHFRAVDRHLLPKMTYLLPADLAKLPWLGARAVASQFTSLQA